MADALCGPVNPLSSFQKHAQQDRSLQNDRLISRAGPSQGFRSSSRNAGSLDPEFEAFQAGFPTSAPLVTATPPPFFQQQQNFPTRFQTPPAQHVQASAVPDWAVDFQRMNLSTPSPVHSLKHNERQAQMPYTTSAPSMYSQIAQDHSFSSPMFDQMNSMSMMGAGYGPGVGLGYMPGEQQNMLNQQAQTSAPVFDEAAFASAFDSAAAFLQQPETKQEAAIEMKHEHVNTYREDIDALMKSGDELDAIMGEYQSTDPHSMVDRAHQEILQRTRMFESQPLNQPFVEEQTTIEDHVGRDDSDALARTAGELLDSVSHDTSDKFAQSSFLALMRSLASKEVKVEGENFVDSSTNSIMNTTGVASSTEDIEPDANATAGGNVTRMSEAWEPIVSPARPLTPEIDPPAPTLAMWRKRLLG